MPEFEVSERKKVLRAEMRGRRAEALTTSGVAAARRLAEIGIDFVRPAAGSVVSAFASMPDELDTAPLLTRLHRDGHRLALPVMQGRNLPLLFRCWQPGDRMATAQWGIQEPLSEQSAVDPDVLLVPLLAFDARGYRLGYGGGYYDRSIASLKQRKSILTIGLALDTQEIDDVPHLDYDQRLDWVLTPSGPRNLQSRCPQEALQLRRS